MSSHALPFVAGEPAAVQPVAAPVAAPNFTAAEIKARAKAIKKQRNREARRFFGGICACLHALGFSY